VTIPSVSPRRGHREEVFLAPGPKKIGLGLHAGACRHLSYGLSVNEKDREQLEEKAPASRGLKGPSGQGEEE